MEGLLGACLQAMLEKFGSGLEGTALTTEFSSLLALVRPCIAYCLSIILNIVPGQCAMQLYIWDWLYEPHVAHEQELDHCF